MKVYVIECDKNEQYQSFIAESGEGFRFDCYPKPDHWKLPALYINDPQLKRPNFFWWVPNVLIVDEKTISNIDLCEVLEMSGQLLEFDYKNEKFTLFNPLRCWNCLNDDLSDLKYDTETGETVIKIEKYVFHPQRLPEIPLFTIPEDTDRIYTITGMKDPEDEFFYRVQDNNLKGITFKLVWFDEE
jgi:hypothetical protein